MKLFKKCAKVALSLVAAFMVCGSVAWAAPNASCTGTIDHETYQAGQKGTCSVSELPTNVAEFKALQAKVATEPQGAVLCFAAAMNIYVHDEAAGKECLKLASYNFGPSEYSLLKDKLRGNDSYCQKYLPMAAFKGATPANAYTPDKPYTVEVEVCPGKPYNMLTDAEAPVIYLNYKTEGTDQGKRPVSVIQPCDSDYFVVFERGAMMLQVRNASRKALKKKK